MSRFFTISMLLASTAVSAQEQSGEYCAVICSYYPGSNDILEFSCGDDRVTDTLNEQAYPNRFENEVGTLAHHISQKNPLTGTNIIWPHAAKIFYNCAKGPN